MRSTWIQSLFAADRETAGSGDAFRHEWDKLRAQADTTAELAEIDAVFSRYTKLSNYAA